MNDLVTEIVFSKKEIEARCKELGKQISKDYKGKKPLLIGLLKGSVPFMAELIKNITIDMEIDFMDVSSYNGIHSTGAVTILKDVKQSVVNRDVIFVEDIVDTGLTLLEVMNLFKDRGAKSLEIAALLDKPSGRKTEYINPKYIAKTIEGGFVVGFGLDYNQLYRNLPYVGILNPKYVTK